MVIPEVLLISNKFDFSTDFIAAELNKRNIKYLRINRDELKDYTIRFNPISPEILGSFNDISFKINSHSLKSIYYRAPSFLRDIFQEGLTEEEQLIRTQWAAFVRSLIVFENIRWFNNPAAIYKAEIKPFQLYLANKIGFKVPKSIISNEIVELGSEYLAIKSIDTAILNKIGEEGFIYTSLYEKKELKSNRYSSPFFNQQGLIPKIDIRVTVIENNIIAVKIQGEHNIDDDWRKYKNKLRYSIIELPSEITNLCIKYVEELDLRFGAIDLILCENEYYFIEINPTGEWSWLQKSTGFNFDKIIVNSLKK